MTSIIKNGGVATAGLTCKASSQIVMRPLVNTLASLRLLAVMEVVR